MRIISFGKLEQIELRLAWTSEDRDFTPWLALPENLEELGKTLNIELELEAQEQSVGPFRADILCKNTVDDSWVLIENQIERTDHKHLGQLLTYAAGLKAVTIVWIASEFTEEHRAAIDWLNEITAENYRFFAIQIELWRIGDSSPAPRFNVICKPNDWASTTRQAVGALSSQSTTPAQDLRIKYWTAFRNYLETEKSKLRAQKPSYDHWYHFGIGTSLAKLAALLITKDDKIAVSLYINGKDAKQIFNEALQHKSEIERVIGAPLEWREMPDKRVSRVVLFKDADPYNTDDWQNQFAWLRDTLERFDDAFRTFFRRRSEAS